MFEINPALFVMITNDQLMIISSLVRLIHNYYIIQKKVLYDEHEILSVAICHMGLGNYSIPRCGYIMSYPASSTINYSFRLRKPCNLCGFNIRLRDPISTLLSLFSSLLNQIHALLPYIRLVSTLYCGLLALICWTLSFVPTAFRHPFDAFVSCIYQSLSVYQPFIYPSSKNYFPSKVLPHSIPKDNIIYDNLSL